MTVLDRIIDFKFDKGSNMTLLKIIAMYYLIVANNYTKYLHSNQLSTFLSNNKFAQLIISYLTILFITVNFSGINDMKIANLYSSIAFVIFILSTKLDLYWSIGVILVIFFFFFYENKTVNKLNIVKKDEAISNEEKKNIKNDIKLTRRSAIITLIIIIIIGMIGYANKKYTKFADKFSVGEFLI